MTPPRTLLDKIWDSHVVAPETADAPAVLYVDLHLVHEVTSPQAFDVLRRRGLGLRRPELTLATMDHATPTVPVRNGALPTIDDKALNQIRRLHDNCREYNVRLFDMSSDRRGIVHVIGPELGATAPGKTIVCGDSHTSTHGAFGALAFGIGTTEVGHVMATQCLLQRKPKTFAVNITGSLRPGVTAKDVILAVINRIGVGGATGHVIEYRGPAIEAMSMEQRMTVCNMSIEAGARAGMVAPDEITFDYLRGRPQSPASEDFDEAVRHWRTLRSDPGAAFDRAVTIDASAIEPMITYGTNPGMSAPVGGHVPTEGDESLDRALQYMGLHRGQRLSGLAIDVVFIGSCTNARLSDLRQAAAVIEGRRVAQGVQMLVVPGSQQIKRQAEYEGLDRIFTDAGAEWRESGCSMCLAMNGDRVGAGRYAVSTSNRNFEGRQGAGARTLLASPLTAAATAIRGRITDPRRFIATPVGV